MSSTTGASPTVEESVGGGEDAGVPRVWDAAGALVGAFGQGRADARETARSGQELAKITVGRSEVAPAKGDRRLSDPAWTANPRYHRAGQSYLASAEAIGGVVGAWARTADQSGGDQGGLRYGRDESRPRCPAKRAGRTITPSTAPGSHQHPPLDPAPGLYARDLPPPQLPEAISPRLKFNEDPRRQS